jgi:hypothetical protein
VSVFVSWMSQVIDAVRVKLLDGWMIGIVDISSNLLVKHEAKNENLLEEPSYQYLCHQPKDLFCRRSRRKTRRKVHKPVNGELDGGVRVNKYERKRSRDKEPYFIHIKDHF